MKGWRAQVAGIVRAEEDENSDLHEIVAVPDFPLSSRVTILVHPGDASDEAGIDAALAGMTRDLEERMDAGDAMIVLHRFSSVYMDPRHDYAVRERPPVRDWFRAVGRACSDRRSWQLYGDHLDDFSARVAPVLVGAQEVVVTGLWGDADDGCAARVVRHLSEAGLPARLGEHVPRAWERGKDPALPPEDQAPAGP